MNLFLAPLIPTLAEMSGVGVGALYLPPIKMQAGIQTPTGCGLGP